jgi:hypothetical protein
MPDTLESLESLESQLAAYWDTKGSNTMENEYKLTVQMPDRNFSDVFHFTNLAKAQLAFIAATTPDCQYALLEWTQWDEASGTNKTFGVWKYENWEI